MRKMQPIDTIDMSVLRESLARQTDNFILEAKLNPAIIYMKRGTVIPAHHIRKIRSPHGTEIIVVGIHPANIALKLRRFAPFLIKLRDFYSSPHEIENNYGYWPDGEEMQPDIVGIRAGYYNKRGHDGCYRCHQKFRVILTININNIERIEYPQVD